MSAPYLSIADPENPGYTGPTPVPPLPAPAPPVQQQPSPSGPQPPPANYDDIVASSVGSQWTINDVPPPAAPPSTPVYSPTPESDYAASGYDPSFTPQSGLDIFFQGQYGPPEYTPTTAPTPGGPMSNWGWFGTPEQQQQQLGWWEAEMSKAQQFWSSTIPYGNGAGQTGQEYAKQLRGEAGAVNELWKMYDDQTRQWAFSNQTRAEHQRASYDQDFMERYQNAANFGASLGAIDAETDYLAQFQQPGSIPPVQGPTAPWANTFSQSLGAIDDETAYLNAIEPYRQALARQGYQGVLMREQFGRDVDPNVLRLPQAPAEYSDVRNTNPFMSTGNATAVDSRTGQRVEGQVDALGRFTPFSESADILGTLASWAGAGYEAIQGSRAKPLLDYNPANPFNRGTQAVNDQLLWISEERFIPGGISLADLAIKPSEKTWQGLSYGASLAYDLLQGLPQTGEKLQAVFDAYVQMGTPRGQRPGGLVYQIQHGGEIENSDVLLGAWLRARERYDSQPFVVRLGGEAIVDPWNFVPFGLARKTLNAKRFSRLFQDVLTPEEMDGLKTMGVTISDKTAIIAGQRTIAQRLGLPNDPLGNAFAMRLSALTFTPGQAGTSTADVLARELGKLDELVVRLGGTEQDAARVRQSMARAKTRKSIMQLVDDLRTPSAVPEIITTPRTPEDTFVARQQQRELVAEDIAPRAEPTPTPRTTQVFADDPAYALPRWLVQRMEKTANWHAGTSGYDPLTIFQSLPTERQTYQVAYDLVRNAPATPDQLRTLRAMLGEVQPGGRRKFTPDVAKAVREGRLTASEAGDLIHTHGNMPKPLTLVANGHSSELLDEALPYHDPAYFAAVARQQLRDSYAGDTRALLPVFSTDPHPSPQLQAKGFIRAVQGQQVTPEGIGQLPALTPLQLVTLFETQKPTLTGNTLLRVIQDIIDVGAHKGPTSKGTTTDSVFKDYLNDLVELMGHEKVPLEDVEQVYHILYNHYFESSIRLAKEAADVAARAANLSTRTAADIAKRKADTTRLLAEIDAAKAAGDKATVAALRSQVRQNTKFIKSFEPDYTTKPPKKPPAVRAAERDQRLAEAGYKVTPSSDPATGFPLRGAGVDSTNDVLDHVTTVGPLERPSPVIKATETPGPAIRATQQQMPGVVDAGRTSGAEAWLARGGARADWMRRAVEEGRSLGDVTPPMLQSMKRAGTDPEAVADVIRRGGTDVAAGDGLGFIGGGPLDPLAGLPTELQVAIGAGLVYAEHAGYKLYRYVRPARNIIDPIAREWGTFNWADPDYVRRFDEVMTEMYGDVTKLAKASAERKRVEIARSSDMMAVAVLSKIDELHGAPDPMLAFRTWVAQLQNPATRIDDLAEDNPWLLSKAGRTALRDFRLFGNDILQGLDAGKYELTMSIGWLPDFIRPKVGPSGILSRGQMQDLDNLVMGSARDRRWSDEDFRRVEDFRAAARTGWTRIRTNPAYFDPVRARWTPVDRRMLDAVLFPRGAIQPVDIIRTSERMSSDLADLMAARLGYKYSDLPFLQKLMTVIKGNFAPLWMTIWPGYHVRNLAGNLTSWMLASLRSDMHVRGLPFRSKMYTDVLSRPGSGVMPHPWVMTGLTTQSGSDVETGQRLVPKLLKMESRWSPFHYGPVTGDVVESWSKQVGFSKEWEHTYKQTWNEGLKGANTLNQAMKTDLMGVAGLDEVERVMGQHGASWAQIEEALALQRGSIAEANMQAYKTTAEYLRDYRMRNRLDGVLDRFVPIHYWATKNALFVGRTVANQPAIAPAAYLAYDQWQESNQDLPLSMRTGLVPLKADWIPGVDSDKEYWLRVSNIINPAAFAVPRLLAPEAWDLSKTTLPDRLDSYALLGMRNLWAAMGYQIGPQWDFANRIASVGAQHVNPDDGWLARFFLRTNQVGNWLAAPSGYSSPFEKYDPFEVANRRDLLPFPLPGSKLGWAERKLFGSNVIEKYVVEWMNQFTYGSPYTRIETGYFVEDAAKRWKRGDITKEQYYVILGAFAEGTFDPTEDDLNTVMIRNDSPNLSKEQAQAALDLVRPIISHVLDNRAEGYWLAMAGASGRTYTPEQRQIDAAKGTYGQMKELENRDLTARDVAFLKELVGADGNYEDLLTKQGRASAWLWLEAEAPWLPGFWSMFDTPEQIQSRIVAEDANTVNELSYAKARAWWDGRFDTDAAPYYDKLGAIDEREVVQRNRAGDNGFLVDLAARQGDEDRAALYASASSNGVSLIPAGELLPKQTRAYYDLKASNPRVWEELFSQPGIEGSDRALAQRNDLLSRVARTLGLQKYITGPDGEEIINPKFAKETSYGWVVDKDAFSKAVKEQAELAVATYANLVNGQIALGAPIHLGALVSVVNPADFIAYIDRRDIEVEAWRERRTAERAAYYDMPEGPAKEAEAQRLRQEYGGAILLNEQRQDIHSMNDATTRENYIYNARADKAEEHYHTLRSSEKKNWQARFPHAFAPAEMTDPDTGETFTYQQFDGTKLTSEELATLSEELGSAMRIGMRNIDREGAGTGAILSPEKHAAERERIATNEALAESYSTWLDRDFLDSEQAQAERDYLTYLDTQGSKPTQFNGQETTLEDAADLALNLPETQTKAGYASWKKTASWARANGYPELADYIDGRYALNETRKELEVNDAKADWFAGLPANVQQALLDEYPDTFTYYAGLSSAGDAGATGQPSGQPSGQPVATDGGSPGRSVSGESRPSYSGSYSSGGGGNYGTNAVGTGGGNYTRDLYSFDPVLSQGQDDGRGAVVEQMGDLLALYFDYIRPLYGDQEQFYTVINAIMGGIRRMIHTTPTLEAWQRLLEFWSSIGPQAGGPVPKVMDPSLMGGTGPGGVPEGAPLPTAPQLPVNPGTQGAVRLQ